MKATELLKRQQRHIRALLLALDAGHKLALVRLARLLTAQMAAERELFYPAVLHLAQDAVLDAVENQARIAAAMRRALSARARDEAFESRVGALKGLVSELVEAEEQSLLPCLAGKVPSERLEVLGEQMEQRFRDVSKWLRKGDYRRSARRPSALAPSRRSTTPRARVAPAPSSLSAHSGA